MARGELLCLIGHSGCGKTTLPKILAGFLRPTHGCCLVEGKKITGPGRDCCVVFQVDALFSWLTVRENTAFGLNGCKLTKKEWNKEVDRFLDLVGLTGYGNYLPRELSGGMKQRVALARVLILSPLLLLMNEPFGALDAQTRERIQGLFLKRLTGGLKEEMSIPLKRPRNNDAEKSLCCCKCLHNWLRETGG